MKRAFLFSGRLIRGLVFVVTVTVVAKFLQIAAIETWGDSIGFDLASLSAIIFVIGIVYYAARKAPSLGWMIGRNG